MSQCETTGGNKKTNFRPILLVFSNCVPHERVNKILQWLMSFNSQSAKSSFLSALFQSSIIIYTSYNLSAGPLCCPLNQGDLCLDLLQSIPHQNYSPPFDKQINACLATNANVRCNSSAKREHDDEGPLSGRTFSSPVSTMKEKTNRNKSIVRTVHANTVFHEFKSKFPQIFCLFCCIFFFNMCFQ